MFGSNPSHMLVPMSSSNDTQESPVKEFWLWVALEAVWHAIVVAVAAVFGAVFG